MRLEHRGTVALLRAGQQPLQEHRLPAAEAVFQEALAGGARQFVVDLDLVPLVDSLGMQWLLDCQDLVHSRGGSLKFANVRGIVRDALEATGLMARFEDYPTTAAALGSFI